jgi:putative ABC transport system substrate-binding protein
MDRRVFFQIMSVSVIGQPFRARAQNGGVKRIGYMTAQSHEGGLNPLAEAFRQGLADRGWREGKDVVIEYRRSGGKTDVATTQAMELANSGVDVIVAAGANSYDVAYKAGIKTPVVFCAHGDPIGVGHAVSLAHPGGNMTGLSFFQAGLTDKKLDLLLAVAPNTKRVGVLWDPTPLIAVSTHRSIEEAIKRRGLDPVSVKVLAVWEFGSAVERLKDETDAVFIVGSPLLYFNSKTLVSLINKSMIPSVFPFLEDAQNCALLVYAPDQRDLYRRCSIYVDKILKGADPAGLPIEQPTKYKMVVNLHAAKEIGVDIPIYLIAMADQVVD